MCSEKIANRVSTRVVCKECLMVGHKKTACPNKSKAALCPLPKQEHFYFSKRFSQIFPSDRELACSEFRSMSVEDRVKT